MSELTGSGRLAGMLRHAMAMLLTWFAVSANADATLDYGVYASDKPTTVVRQFRPLLNALEQDMARRLGEPVHIRMKVASSYEQGLDDLITGKVGFSRFGPASYVLAKQAFPSLRLVAMETNKGEKSFDGAIVVRADSPIRSIKALAGKRFAFGDDQSTIGRYLAQLLLLENGIRAVSLKQYEYLNRHDTVGAAVADGRFDAGALKEGTLVKLVADGMALRVLQKFPNVTKPWIAHPSMPQNVYQALHEAMLNLKDEEAFKQLASDGADGFADSTDAEYDRIRTSIARNPEFFR